MDASKIEFLKAFCVGVVWVLVVILAHLLLVANLKAFHELELFYFLLLPGFGTEAAGECGGVVLTEVAVEVVHLVAGDQPDLVEEHLLFLLPNQLHRHYFRCLLREQNREFLVGDGLTN